MEFNHQDAVEPELAYRPTFRTFYAMKFFVALLVWFLIAAVMASGIVMVVTGKHLVFRGDLLIASLLVYIGLFSKYGCLSH
jgi:hypothetical protein